ncbi:MAG: DMT family transporter [Rikenellaceae bacterium]|nr:DMT family transporter [Rikenellaceae bacterium]
MNKKSYHWDLALSNALSGANLSFFVSLTRNGIAYEQLFMLQVAAGALCFIPLALLSPHTYRLAWHDLKHIFFVALLVIYGWMFLLVWGASYTTPIDGAIIATLGPAFTLLADRLINRRVRLNAGRIVGICCAFAGAWLLVFDKGFVLVHGSRGFGNLLILFAVLATATNTVLIKPQLERLGAATIIGWYYFIGLVVTLPFFGHLIHPEELLRLPSTLFWELLYLLVLGTVGPMWLLYRGTERLTAVHTALYRYIQPLVAGTLGFVRHQTAFDRTNLAALALIFLGILGTVIGYRRSLKLLSESLAPRHFHQRRRWPKASRSDGPESAD